LTSTDAQLVNIDNEKIDQTFMEHFSSDIEKVKQYVGRKIGTFTHSIYTRDSFFGSSAFSDFIHDIQLDFTGADFSLNAPLKFDACIHEGDIHVSDLFNLYTYENQLYVVRMTGKEVRLLLEMSYDQWITTMQNPNDHIMLMDQETDGHWHWHNPLRQLNRNGSYFLFFCLGRHTLIVLFGFRLNSIIIDWFTQYCYGWRL